MIKKTFNLLLFCFFISTLQAQETQDSTIDYTQLFDSIIQNDTTCKVEIREAQNFVKTMVPKPDLVYDKDKKYSWNFIFSVICSRNIEEAAKLDFVKAALADKEQNIFRYFYSGKCPCLDTQIHLRELLSNHFKAISTTPNNKYEAFHYLEFVAINQLPGYLNLIEDYFSSRDSLQHFYLNETKLPLYLIRAGQEQRALELMEMFVEDQKNGKISYLKDGAHAEKENIFTLLAFSDDPEVSRKAMDLAFEYYRNITRGYTYSLGLFLEYHDIKRFKQALEFWLEEYPSLDSTEYSVNSGFRTLLAGDGLMIAEQQGYPYWQLFVNNLNRWKKYNESIDDPMMNIALACMKGTKQASEKQAIIDFVKQHNIFIRNDSKARSRAMLKKFMELLILANPYISENEIGQIVPERYDDWKYAYGQLKDRSVYQLDETAFYSRVSIFQKYGYAQNMKLDKYDKFLFHIGDLNIYRLLQTTENIIWFDTEGGMFPLSYADLFKDEFHSVLLKKGIDFLSVDETHEINERICHYTITISNADKTYTIEFANGSDWYEVIPFMKALNMALKDSGSDLRFIYLDSRDQTTLIGLFDPNKFLPMAKELALYCYALNYGDGFMEETW
jgi:hypothetical protein